MRRPLSRGLYALLSIVLPACAVDAPAPAQEDDLGTTRQGMTDEEVAARLALAYFDNSLSTNGIQGYCASLVSDKLAAADRTLVHCYGTLRPSGGTLDGNTIFDLGSISKLFTAELLADEVLRNQRCYADKLIDRLHDNGFTTTTGAPRTPSVAAAKKGTIYLEELATHTSGLSRNPQNAPDASGTYSLDDLYDAFANDRMGCKPSDPATATDNSMTCVYGGTPDAIDPGHAVAYSNFGFGLLGHALTRGTAFWFDIVKTRFLDPLGMTHTGLVTMTAAEKATMAWGNDNAATVNTPWQDWPAGGGGSGMHSTSNDMVKWMKFHMAKTSLGNARLGSPTGCAIGLGSDPIQGPGSPPNLDKVVNEAWRPRFHENFGNGNDSRTWMGLGWVIEPGWSDPKGHEGDTFVLKDGSVGMPSVDTIFWTRTGFAVKDGNADPRKGERSVGVTVLAVASQSNPNQANAKPARDKLLTDLLDALR